MVDDNKTRIENELKANKEKLEDIKKTIDDQNKEQQQIKQYVAELEKVNGEMKQIDASYEKIFTERVELEAFSNTKTIDDDVKELIPQINETRSRLDQAAGYPSKQVRDLEDHYSSLNSQLAGAQITVEQTQKKYEETKTKQKDNEANLKAIRELKSAIQREQPDNKAAAYELIELMRKKIQDLKLKDPAEFAQEMEAAGKALADANKDSRTKSLALEKVRTDLEEARKKESKYRDDVLVELRKLKPQPQAKLPPQGKQQTQSKQQSQASAAATS